MSVTYSMRLKKSPYRFKTGHIILGAYIHPRSRANAIARMNRYLRARKGVYGTLIRQGAINVISKPEKDVYQYNEVAFEIIIRDLRQTYGLHKGHRYTRHS